MRKGKRPLKPATPSTAGSLGMVMSLRSSGPSACRASAAKCGLSAGGLDALGGLFDKCCDRPWLRHVDGVAALDLDDRGTRPLRHGTLGTRRDHLILGDNQVPAWLRLPRGLADRTAESRYAPWDLG